MSITYACVLPHPPLILPEIGRGEELKIQNTINAYQSIAQTITKIEPDTIVLVSPHAPMLRDGFFIADGEIDAGDMVRFNAANIKGAYPIDQAFVQALSQIVPNIKAHEIELDHGSLVPLVMLDKTNQNFKLVRIGISGLGREQHRELGKAIQSVAQQLNRKTVFIASGDLSHRLKAEGPYGFDSQGPLFDQAINNILEVGKLEELFELSAKNCDQAGECGYRSLLVLAGALDEFEIKPKVLSYEAPFGVGYLCASIQILDPIVALARKAIEHYVIDQSTIDSNLIKHIDPHMQGACFVSLHQRNQLRGCIGTLQPTQHNLIEEIIHNAVAACSRDPRFNPVTRKELVNLDISVDVLSPAQKVNRNQLDPKRYGVIVHSAWRTGVLLPDLEGVDTVAKQLDIALRKAGIDPSSDYTIERFEVERHHDDL